MFLNDILVSDCTFEQELENLRVVFLRLKEVKLNLAPKKCSSSKFLGHIVSEKGVATDPDKLRSVSTWPRPTISIEVRQFLGLCSYNRHLLQYL